MKKLLILVYLIIFVFSMTACSNGNSLYEKDYDFVIFDNSKVHIFKEENGVLKEVDKFSRTGEKANHWKMNFIEDENYIYTRTAEMRHDNPSYLTKINLDTYNEENSKFEYPNALGLGKDFVYGASVRGLETIFTKFDKNSLKIISEKSITDDLYLKVVRDIFEVNDILYVLVGEVNVNTGHRG